MTNSTPQSHEEVLSAAEAIGELMEYWGFKRIHGVLWTILFVEDQPLSQRALLEITGYSKGAVSMALGELDGWGVVRISRAVASRERKYEAETDLGAMIRGVLRQRELRMLERASDRFDESVRSLGAMSDALSKRQRARLRTLNGLTQTAIVAVEQFVETGALELFELKKYFDSGLDD